MKKLIILVVSILLVTGCSFSKNKAEVKNAKLNNNENIIREQTNGSFKFSDVSLSYLDGTSTFKVTVTNDSDSDVAITKFDIVFKTENGSVITTLNGYLADTMASKESLDISLTSDIDLSEAYAVEYDIG